MQKKWKIMLSIIIISIIGGLCFLNKPNDIRNEYLKKEITETDYQKGKELIRKMEEAYGGRTHWESYSKGTFEQVADWYGRKKISNWEVVPQRFEMTAKLGADDSYLQLLNGPSSGTVWGFENGNSFGT